MKAAPLTGRCLSIRTNLIGGYVYYISSALFGQHKKMYYIEFFSVTTHIEKIILIISSLQAHTPHTVHP